VAKSKRLNDAVAGNIQRMPVSNLVFDHYIIAMLHTSVITFAFAAAWDSPHPVNAKLSTAIYRVGDFQDTKTTSDNSLMPIGIKTLSLRLLGR